MELFLESQYLEASKQNISLVRPARIYTNYVETYMYYCATRDLTKMDGFELGTFSSDDEKQKYDKNIR